LRVLLFGRLADVAGWRERTIEGAPTRLSTLTDLLARDDPNLGEALAARGVRVAVDKLVVTGNVDLGPDAEVAFLPPMSGG
jgi:molybdopterin synthase sulfur carrier subunit